MTELKKLSNSSDVREAVARAICVAKKINPDAIGYGVGREMPEGTTYPLWHAQLSAADAAIETILALDMK